MLRQDVSSVSAMLLACEGGYAPVSLFQAEVRKTIVQWHERLSDAISAPKPAALLLGQFLAGVPDREAREEFRAVLAEWADSALEASQREPEGARPRPPQTASDRKLEDLATSLLFAEDLTDEERRQAGRRALALLKRRPPHQPPSPAEVEVVTIVFEVVPELEAKAFRLFAKQVKLLASSGQLDSGVWRCVASAPAKLRLALLDKVADMGGAAAFEDCGIGVDAVLGACADFAVEEAARGRARARGRGGPRAQAFRVLHLVASSLVEDADVGDAHRGFALLHVFGRAIGRAGPTALRPLLLDMQQRPCQYDLVDFVALADALADGGPDNPCWDMLAVALVDHWGALDRRALLRALSRAPAALASVPEPFQLALARRCEERPDVFQGVEAEGLLHLLARWPSFKTLVGAPRRLLRAAIDMHLCQFNARGLVRASILLDDDRPAAVEEIASLWRRWFEGVAAPGLPARWENCGGALREVERWRRRAADPGRRLGAASVADAVLVGVVAEQICTEAESAPLELLFGLARALGGASPAPVERLAELLEIRVRWSLRGSETLPVSLAVALASGRTPVRCTREAPYWNALVLSIVAKMRTTHEVDAFCRGEPSVELWQDVAREAGGWRSLELQSRLAA